MAAVLGALGVACLVALAGLLGTQVARTPPVDEPTYPSVRGYLSEHLDPQLVGREERDAAPPGPGGGGAASVVMPAAAAGAVAGSEGETSLEDTGQLLYVKYTLADASAVASDETIDSVWSDADHAAETVWAQYETVVNVYDPGTGPYCVALVDNTRLNAAGTVLDAAFAEHNTHGEPVDGVIYDREAGIAYLPRDLYRDGEGEDTFHPLAAQLLVSYDFSGDRSCTVDVTCTSDRPDVAVAAARQPVRADGIDVSFSVPVVNPTDADKVSLSDLAVYLGDSERPLALEDGVNARYDPSSGKLELLASALTLSSLRVEVMAPDAATALVDAVTLPTQAHAAEAGSLGMWPYGAFTNLDVSRLSEGQAFDYESPVKYDYNHDHFADIAWANQTFWRTVPYVYTSFENGATDFSPGSSNWVFQQMKNGTTWDEIKEHISSTPVSASPGDINFMIALPGDESVGTQIGGLDWSGLTSPIEGLHDDERYDTWIDTVAFCSHITQPDNHLTIDQAYQDGRGTVTMRVLKVERTGESPYLIVGFCAPQVTTQSGISIIKFAIRSQGSLALEKASADPAVTEGNPLYDLAGAEYGVYRDAGCTDKVGTIVTDADGTGRMDGLTSGTYYVREDVAPDGFFPDASVREVSVAPGATATVSFSEEPGYDASWSLVQKLDAQLGATAQGSATLGGAQFEVAHYGNLDGDVSGTPLRTWVLESDTQGRVASDTASFVEGDPYLTAEGATALPLGTYAIREVAAPEGYVLSDPSTHVAVLELDEEGGVRWRALDDWDNAFAVESMQGRGISDEVARGSVRLTKLDAETGLSRPLGGAALEGTLFDIFYAGEGSISFDGKTLGTGDLVTTIETTALEGEDGTTYVAATPDQSLPVGHYRIVERRSSTGYALGGYETEFDIQGDGVVEELAGAENPVIRGGLSFNKVDGQTQEGMAGIPFLITARSDTDGDGVHERHLAVTDENGILTTDLPNRDNANDAALVEGEDGTLSVDEGRLDPAAGFWFAGATDVEATPRDGAQPMPYDTYDVEELPCSANEGKRLVRFSVSITRDGAVVDRGTVENDDGPAISTALTDAASGTKSVGAGPTTLTDTVSYENLEPGCEYVLTGSLMNARTGEAIIDGEGSPVTSEVAFTPGTSSGSVEVSFEVDTTELAGESLVAFETLGRDGRVVAEHADLSDAGQTVGVPAIATSATVQGQKVAPSTGVVAVDDLVICRGLTPGESYTLEARLVDGDTGEAIKAGNEEARGTAEFTAESSDESHQVSVEVDATQLGGRRVVVMETLNQGDRVVASHEDLASEEQSVRFVGIGTTLTNAESGGHLLPEDGPVTLTDTVSYSGLTPGATYEVRGTIMDAATGRPVVTPDGHPLTSTATFQAEGSSGEVEVTFTVEDAARLPHTVVAFETLLEQGRELAIHASLNDEAQTMRRPRLGTTLTDESDGDHEAVASQHVALVDAVRYEGLRPGVEYQLVGTLMDAETGTVLQGPNGAPVTSEVTLAPDESSGVSEVRFEFDAGALAGRKVVAFERLLLDGEAVAAHEDLSDTAQTVAFAAPSTGTDSTGAGVGTPKTGDLLPSPVGALVAGAVALVAAALFRRRFEDKSSEVSATDRHRG